jgi:hypothetical protein
MPYAKLHFYNSLLVSDKQQKFKKATDKSDVLNARTLIRSGLHLYHYLLYNAKLLKYERICYNPNSIACIYTVIDNSKSSMESYNIKYENINDFIEKNKSDISSMDMPSNIICWMHIVIPDIIDIMCDHYRVHPIARKVIKAEIMCNGIRHFNNFSKEKNSSTKTGSIFLASQTSVSLADGSSAFNFIQSHMYIDSRNMFLPNLQLAGVVVTFERINIVDLASNNSTKEIYETILPQSSRLNYNEMVSGKYPDLLNKTIEENMSYTNVDALYNNNKSSSCEVNNKSGNDMQRKLFTRNASGISVFSDTDSEDLAKSLILNPSSVINDHKASPDTLKGEEREDDEDGSNEDSCKKNDADVAETRHAETVDRRVEMSPQPRIHHRHTLAQRNMLSRGITRAVSSLGDYRDNFIPTGSICSCLLNELSRLHQLRRDREKYRCYDNSQYDDMLSIIKTYGPNYLIIALLKLSLDMVSPLVTHYLSEQGVLYDKVVKKMIEGKSSKPSYNDSLIMLQTISEIKAGYIVMSTIAKTTYSSINNAADKLRETIPETFVTSLLDDFDMCYDAVGDLDRDLDDIKAKIRLVEHKNYMFLKLLLSYVFSIFVPLNFIVGMFGMNFKYNMPLINNHRGVSIGSGVLCITAAIIYCIFVFKGWIEMEFLKRIKNFIYYYYEGWNLKKSQSSLQSLFVDTNNNMTEKAENLINDEN